LPLTPLLAIGVFGLWIQLRDASSRTDALAVLALLVLTVLAISSMSNWRGGWKIGPRYLALTVPFLGAAALPSLERIAESAPAHARALAFGALIAGIVASGALGAYYPHLPPELTRPLPQLLWVLIDHGFAPRNAGNLLGVYGSASMLPLAFLGLVILLHGLRELAGVARQARVALSALVIAAVLVMPALRRPDAEPGVRGAVAFVTRRWTPEGHDEAARLRAELMRGPEAHHRELERLTALYEVEGRDQEARRARAGRL
jgi:hypothetical protein